MKASIRPLSAVPKSAVLDYFRRLGVPREIAEWKYFDAAFNRGRERGFVWAPDGQVQGFLGLIPCRVGRGDRSWEMHWTCDWSLESPGRAPGLGVLLVREAMRSVDRLVTVGGNEQSLKLAPRLAEHTVEDAAVVFQLPLRLGPVLEGLGRGTPLARLATWPLLAALPLRRTPRARAAVRTEAGVSSALAPLLELPRSRGWYPRYDLEHLDWIVGRCPALECGTSYAPATARPEAAALVWRPKTSRARWRMALWAEPGAGEPLAAVLAEVMRRVRGQGGALVSVLVSPLDTHLLDALGSQPRARPRARYPLFVLTTRDTDPPIEELGALSFLDTDWAYLF